MKSVVQTMVVALPVGIAAIASCGRPTTPPPPTACAPAAAPSPPQGIASDPGPNGGGPTVGGSYATVTVAEQTAFSQALGRFRKVDSVSGSVANEPGIGLGPAFNGNSCAMCHAQPTVGGSSPGPKSPQAPLANPQIALASLDGATNAIPSFVTADGPVRSARFVTLRSAAGTPRDGTVHDLFTIRGRSDAQGCTLAQPDFAGELAANNVVFRIPTPLYGLGLIEATPDATLAANLAANAADKCALGIVGRLNTNPDGAVTRFGWKAQHESLLLASGNEYSAEQGVSSEANPSKLSATAGCIFGANPEDSTNLVLPGTQTTTGTASQMSSDVVNFALFIRLLAPPRTRALSGPAANGAALFSSVGCAQCHTPSLTTAASPISSLSSVSYLAYSDLALHHMGSGLSDGIVQGLATEDEFRTAPLWGLGQRLFFLHDGRTSDLAQAIQAHAASGSEANAVVRNFYALSASDQSDLLTFLRSL